jgi:hypothetical protein
MEPEDVEMFVNEARGPGKVLRRKSMAPSGYHVRYNLSGYPVAIAKGHSDVLHLSPSEQPASNAEDVVAILNAAVALSKMKP